jgi:hypothetical protein
MLESLEYFGWTISREEEHLEDLDVDKKLIVKYNLKK